MRTRPRRLASSLILSVAMLGVVGVSPVAAEERSCTGSIGARTLDNVRVPQGARCVLTGTVVKGTISVGRDAVLIARGVRVVGNVQAENAAKVVVKRSSRIGGSVQVDDSGRARVVESRVNGSVQLVDNRRLIEVRRTVVGGDVQAFQNTGGVEIYRNRIDGNLQCKENRPRPVGGGNVVGGNREDQCRGF
jgi:hypothetical protein